MLFSQNTNVSRLCVTFILYICLFLSSFAIAQETTNEPVMEQQEAVLCTAGELDCSNPITFDVDEIKSAPNPNPNPNAPIISSGLLADEDGTIANSLILPEEGFEEIETSESITTEVISTTTVTDSELSTTESAVETEALPIPTAVSGVHINTATTTITTVTILAFIALSSVTVVEYKRS